MGGSRLFPGSGTGVRAEEGLQDAGHAGVVGLGAGRSFERRLDSAELYIALQALLRLPEVVRGPLE
ncbi:hypothetical protein [Streptomyces sp. NPDC008122]|uniref:hypothetical protein n=1 Tax=Streptomyces sp. NPDC008122 TaxID=3364810 RepID=UPI0036E1C78C